MIRTNTVKLSVIKAMAFRQKLASGGSGITIIRPDYSQPGIASISTKTGEVIPTKNCNRKMFPDKAFAEAIKPAKTILWNGPAGVFEFDNFIGGSKAIADAIAEATANGAFSLIGGGDSVACINKFGMADQVSYISTGGGALLEAIEGKVLPGVAAIEA